MRDVIVTGFLMSLFVLVFAAPRIWMWRRDVKRKARKVILEQMKAEELLKLQKEDRYSVFFVNKGSDVVFYTGVYEPKVGGELSFNRLTPTLFSYTSKEIAESSLEDFYRQGYFVAGGKTYPACNVSTAWVDKVGAT